MLSKLIHCACGEKWAEVSPLVLRVALGAIFVYHGYDKVFVKGVPWVVDLLGRLGFPAPTFFAYVLSYGELIAGALLIVGLLTHWAAKFAGIVAVVAFFAVHLRNGFAVSEGGYEFVLLILAAAVSVLITGAGKYSLDAKWMRKDQQPMM